MNSKLHLRVFRIVTFGAIVFTGAASIIFYLYTQSVEQKSMDRVLDQLFVTVQRSAEIAAYLDSKELAEEVIDSLSGNDIVLGSMLLSKNGMIAVSNFQASDTGDFLSFGLFAPFSANEQVGEVRIQPNIDWLNSRVMNSTLERTLILIVQIAVIAVLVLVMTLRVLTYPIQSIAQNLHRIAPGDSNNLDCPKGHETNEIGRLVDDINKLLGAARTTINQEQYLRNRIEILEKHFRLIFERASAGIFLLDKNFYLNSVNPAFKDIVGIAVKERRGSKQSIYLPDLFQDPAAIEKILHDVLETHKQAAYDLRLAASGDGEERWLHCLFSTVKNDDGENLIEGLALDVTARTVEMERILFESQHDVLTQLLNRRAGERLLNGMLTHADKNLGQVALLLIDLNNFKFINDSYGHDAGDKVLIEAAHRMKSAIRKEDTLIRLGGDEFVVGFPVRDDQSDEVDFVVRKLEEKLNMPIDLGFNRKVTISASIGLALFPRDGGNLEALMVSADNAMYQIKKGRA
jgi:diguanylate cyclase (GGDEF)-like protein/PAS domain S-box-containing protein